MSIKPKIDLEHIYDVTVSSNHDDIHAHAQDSEPSDPQNIGMRQINISAFDINAVITHNSKIKIVEKKKFPTTSNLKFQK
jgi:hypothetical protein